MTIEQLQIISYVCFILAAVFFVVSVALFFILKIAQVFGYLTGINAKRAIEDIQSQNAVTESGQLTLGKSQKKSKHNSLSRRLSRENDSTVISTAKLSTSKLRKEAEDTAALTSSETTVLTGAETTVLSGSETTVLSPQETTVLSGSETTVLAGDGQAAQQPAGYGNMYAQPQLSDYSGVFTVDFEIYLAESTELIS